MSDGDWVVEKVESDGSEMVLGIVTGGLFPLLMRSIFGDNNDRKTFVIRNKDTDEIRHVTARDADELGTKIADGDFDD